MAIFKVDDGYVISSHGTWLPGNYVDPIAAKYAFQFQDSTLQKLQDKHGQITLEILKQERQKTREVGDVQDQA